jgi:glycosyltransferase involved in cell wall biosynthesis
VRSVGTDVRATGRTPRPRLLVLASTFPARPDDGTPAFVRDLAIEEGKDFDTLVLVPRVPGAPRTESIGRVRVERFAYFPRRWETLADGAIIENLRSNRARWAQVLPFFLAEGMAVRRAVRRFRPDVVHAHWIVPQGLVATVVARRVPRLVSTLGGDLYALNSPPLVRLKSWVVRNARHTTAVNAEMRDKVVELGGPGTAASVLPMGAALDLAERPDRAARAGDGPCRLVFVGRLVEKKGLAVLLEALRGLEPGLVELTVVGDGPLRESLTRQAAGLPVTFAGQLGRDALRAALREADVAVVPSVLAASGDKDGLPVAMLDAMGTGLPVVASDLPGINEAVVDGTSGVLVPAGDVARLRSAIMQLAVDGPRRLALGEAAAERATSFSVEAVGVRYRELLAGMLPARA